MLIIRFFLLYVSVQIVAAANLPPFISGAWWAILFYAIDLNYTINNTVRRFWTLCVD